MNYDDSSNSALNCELDLDMAIKRVYRNISNGCFPNRLDGAIIKYFPDKVKDRVESLLKDTSMDWANGSARFFDLPKQNGLTRPICYIDVDLAVAYQALVDHIADLIEPYISSEFDDRILSHRLRQSSSPIMFKSPVEAYKTFIGKQHTLAKSKEYSHCVRLDIANYYERIYLHKLQQLLERRNVPGIVTTALCNLLRKFANGDSHGIPQGFWASDYLGNIYLLYLDEFLKSQGVYAIRYVDDYRIFCNSEREAKLILKDCGEMLRGLGLNIQPVKTSIVTVEKLDPELRPVTERFIKLRESTMFLRRFEIEYFHEDELWQEIQGDAPLTDEDVRKFEGLWTEAIDQEDKRTSILSFALAGLSAGTSPTAERYILDNLGRFPYMASAVTKYLISLSFSEDNAVKILNFIESDECIHEWQQMWLLEYFRRTSDCIDPYKRRLIAFMKRPDVHPLSRALIAEMIAFKGDDSDGEEVRRMFSNETDPRLRRHLLLAFRLLSSTDRNYAIGYLPPEEWCLRLVGSLLKSNAKLLDTD